MNSSDSVGLIANLVGAVVVITIGLLIFPNIISLLNQQLPGTEHSTESPEIVENISAPEAPPSKSNITDIQETDFEYDLSMEDLNLEDI